MELPPNKSKKKTYPPLSIMKGRQVCVPLWQAVTSSREFSLSIEVFPKTSGPADVYRNQFHEVKREIRSFATGQYGA